MIKRRNMLFQFVMYIITFGLYGMYWYYSTLEEMTKFQGEKTESVIWTILMFIPLANLFAMWKHASVSAKFTEGTYHPVLLMMVWIFVSPVVWILMQIELNRVAGTPFPDASAAE